MYTWSLDHSALTFTNFHFLKHQQRADYPLHLWGGLEIYIAVMYDQGSKHKIDNRYHFISHTMQTMQTMSSMLYYYLSHESCDCVLGNDVSYVPEFGQASGERETCSVAIGCAERSDTHYRGTQVEVLQFITFSVHKRKLYIIIIVYGYWIVVFSEAID